VIDNLIVSFASLAAAIEIKRAAKTAERRTPPDVEYCDVGGGFVMRRRVPTVEYGNEVDGMRMRRKIPR
jgi:hypothetical protein